MSLPHNHGPTARELQIEALVKSGKSYSDVARMLGVTRITVGSAMSRLSSQNTRQDNLDIANIKSATQQLADAINAMRQRKTA